MNTNQHYPFAPPHHTPPWARGGDYAREAAPPTPGLVKSVLRAVREAVRCWALQGEPRQATWQPLSPDEHKRLKIERYSFSMSPEKNFELGGERMTFDMSLQPNTRIRATQIVMNAPAPNFVLIDSLQVANVNVFVGTTEDAWTYSATAQGVTLDLPTLDPATPASAAGCYTGYLPPDYDGPGTKKVNRGPAPPPVEPSKIDVSLYGRSKKDKKLLLEARSTYDTAMRNFRRQLRTYERGPRLDRIVDERVPGFQFQFIVTFQGPSVFIERDL
jgi:hypothetical protein